MTREEGLPRRPWFRHMIYAPGFWTGYGVKTLPGVREGIEEREWDEVRLFVGEIAAHLVLAVAQVAIILAVGIFVFGANVQGNLAWIFLIALLGALVFLNIGFILSAWARSPAAASGMGNAVALPMMFFAGTFFSTATLPWGLPHAALVLPLTPMLEALRDVAIDSAPLWDTWPQLGLLGIWVAVTAVIATRVFRFS